MSIWDEYKVVGRLAPGLVTIFRSSHDDLSTDPWAVVTVRKDTKCAATGIAIPKGARAYRPMGNQMFRSERIAAQMIDDVAVGGWVA
jgi:hypothetical protein